jgi:sporulation protein YlmC with PRC-barrel domain
MLYSNIKNKVIVSISTANELGTVKGVYIDKAAKAPAYLGVEIGDEKKALKIKDVFCYSDIITVMDDEAITLPDNSENYVFIDTAAKIYDVKAFYIGELTDIRLTPVSYNACLVSKDSFIKMQKIVGIQSGIIIVNTQKKQLRRRWAATAPKLPKAQEPPAIPPPVSAPETEPEQTYAEPPKETVISNYNFLMGRRVLRDIVGINQELLIKKDTIITPKLIEEAKQMGKLVDLTLNSK